MPRRLIDLGEHVAAPITRRTGLAALIGMVAGAVGLSDIDARKKKKKKPITVCASGCKYTSLSDAVGAASAGSTICLKGGDYDSADIYIDKPLTIKPCSNQDDVTIHVPSNKRAFSVDFSNDDDKLTVAGTTAHPLKIQKSSGQINSGGLIKFAPSYGDVPTKGTISLERVEMSGGQAISFGGGIYANTTGSVFLTNSRISSCSASQSGGGIHMVAGEVFMAGTSQINRCSAPEGAGVLLKNAAILTLRDYAMIGGTAQEDKNDAYQGNGGGISAKDFTTVNMANTASIRYNVARDNGGGIFAEQGAILNGYANCSNIGDSGTIKDNTAANGSGSQIYHANTQMIC